MFFFNKVHVCFYMLVFFNNGVFAWPGFSYIVCAGEYFMLGILSFKHEFTEKTWSGNGFDFSAGACLKLKFLWGGVTPALL